MVNTIFFSSLFCFQCFLLQVASLTLLKSCLVIWVAMIFFVLIILKRDLRYPFDFWTYVKIVSSLHGWCILVWHAQCRV